MSARVLIVDDLYPNVRLLETKLSLEYFDVVVAMNGPDALAICEKGACDVVLLDVMMPGMDGFEVCRRLKPSTSPPTACGVSMREPTTSSPSRSTTPR
jgi:two-component system, cell cycle response regulator